MEFKSSWIEFLNCVLGHKKMNVIIKLLDTIKRRNKKQWLYFSIATFNLLALSIGLLINRNLVSRDKEITQVTQFFTQRIEAIQILQNYTFDLN